LRHLRASFYLPKGRGGGGEEPYYNHSNSKMGLRDFEEKKKGRQAVLGDRRRKKKGRGAVAIPQGPNPKKGSRVVRGKKKTSRRKEKKRKGEGNLLSFLRRGMSGEVPNHQKGGRKEKKKGASSFL